MADQVAVEDVQLTPSDIPGAAHCEPLEAPALRWWLKCRGDLAVSTSWKKSKVITRYTDKLLGPSTA